MESLSKPGHIHVSQATADELTAKGRGSWLTMREDKVVAKGKGEMQTFWVERSREGSEASFSSSDLGQRGIFPSARFNSNRGL